MTIQDTTQAWSTLLLDDYGGASIGKTGLTAEQARMQTAAAAITHPEYAEQFLPLAPPDEDMRRDTGTYGLVYVLPGAAFIQLIGISEAEAEQAAMKAAEKYGPGSPREDWTLPDATGCRTKLVNLKPAIKAALVVDTADVMEAMGLPVPGCPV